jgi:lysophospholipase L1-like esterase
MKPMPLLLAALWLSGAPIAPAQTAATIARPVIQHDAKGVITLACDTPGAHIRYSIDGSDPTAKAGPYLAPIELPCGGTVKARAFSEDRKQHSDLAEAAFDAVVAGPRPPSTVVPVTQDRDWPGYDWAKRHAAVCALVRERKPQIVFIGDSITHFFGGDPADWRKTGEAIWKKYYGSRNALDLGFGWDRTENVLWRLRHGELDGASPRVAVVHIGTNNLGINKPDEIAAGIRAICDEIHARSPRTIILLMAIMPRGEKPDATRAKIGEVNKLLSLFGFDYGINFLDIGANFLSRDGTLSRDVMADFLHPTDKGYAIWAGAIEPTMKRLLGEQ